MSRAALEAHNDGDCGWPCVYCDREEARETPVTRTSDGIDIVPEPDPRACRNCDGIDCTDCEVGP